MPGPIHSNMSVSMTIDACVRTCARARECVRVELFRASSSASFATLACVRAFVGVHISVDTSALNVVCTPNLQVILWQDHWMSTYVRVQTPRVWIVRNGLPIVAVPIGNPTIAVRKGEDWRMVQGWRTFDCWPRIGSVRGPVHRHPCVCDNLSVQACQCGYLFRAAAIGRQLYIQDIGAYRA